MYPGHITGPLSPELELELDPTKVVTEELPFPPPTAVPVPVPLPPPPERVLKPPVEPVPPHDATATTTAATYAIKAQK